MWGERKKCWKTHHSCCLFLNSFFRWGKLNGLTHRKLVQARVGTQATPCEFIELEDPGDSQNGFSSASLKLSLLWPWGPLIFSKTNLFIFFSTFLLKLPIQGLALWLSKAATLSANITFGHLFKSRLFCFWFSSLLMQMPLQSAGDQISKNVNKSWKKKNPA